MDVHDQPMTEFIQAVRTSRGLSQKALAERLGISQQSVSKWESGASMPDTSALAQMREVLDVSTDEWQSLYEAEAQLEQPNARVLSIVRLLMDEDPSPAPPVPEGDVDYNSAMTHVPEHIRRAVLELVSPYLDEDERPAR